MNSTGMQTIAAAAGTQFSIMPGLFGAGEGTGNPFDQLLALAIGQSGGTAAGGEGAFKFATGKEAAGALGLGGLPSLDVASANQPDIAAIMRELSEKLAGILNGNGDGELSEESIGFLKTLLQIARGQASAEGTGLGEIPAAEASGTGNDAEDEDDRTIAAAAAMIMQFFQQAGLVNPASAGEGEAGLEAPPAAEWGPHTLQAGETGKSADNAGTTRHQWNLKELSVALRAALASSQILAQAAAEPTTAANQAGAQLDAVKTLKEIGAQLFALRNDVKREATGGATSARGQGTGSRLHQLAGSLQQFQEFLRGRPEGDVQAMTGQAGEQKAATITNEMGFKDFSVPQGAGQTTAGDGHGLVARPEDELETRSQGVAIESARVDASGRPAVKNMNPLGETNGTRHADAIDQVRRFTEIMVARSEGVLQASDRGLEATLKLNPAELGSVRVELVMQADRGIQAQFIAQRPETAALIAQNAQQLSDALAKQGLVVDRVQVASNPIMATSQGQAGGFNGGERESPWREQAWGQQARQGFGEQRRGQKSFRQYEQA